MTGHRQPGPAAPRAPRRLAAACLAIACAAGCTADRETGNPKPAASSRASPGTPTARVPADYVLVGPRGTTARPAPPVDPARAAGGDPLLPGFGFVVTDRRVLAGRLYLQISDGRWLAAADVTPARPSTFAGVALGPGDRVDFAWVVAAESAIRDAPTRTAAVLTTRVRHTRLDPTGPCRPRGRHGDAAGRGGRDGYCPLLVGWVEESDLAFAAIAARPAGVGPADRWIDVDLFSQTLVAYEGDRPAYATLVSTGIGDPGSPIGTPLGTFKIRSRHLLVRMDNLEHTGVVPYAYDVPLAMYFADGKALHAALWHDKFGQPTSHGCINLSPRDAEWLYDFRPTSVRIHGDPPSVALRSTPRAAERERFRF